MEIPYQNYSIYPKIYDQILKQNMNQRRPILSYFIHIVSLLILALTPIEALASETKPPFASKQELFDHFSDPAFFKTLFFQAQDIAGWLSKECDRGEKNCTEALSLMNQPFSKWNQLDAKSGFHTVCSCQNEEAITHPNPKLHKILNKPIIHSLRDIHGRLWILDFCYKNRTHPQGIWGAHFSSWCRSITGINEVWTISYLRPVPGTEYQILSHLPFAAQTPVDAELKVKELNDLIDRWTTEWVKQNTLKRSD